MLNDYPQMRPIIYLIKYFLKQKQLNETYTGGVSSFLILNLVYSYFLYIGKKNDDSFSTLGHVLCGFIQFYAYEFNYELVGISIRNGGFFYKKKERGCKKN